MKERDRLSQEEMMVAVNQNGSADRTAKSLNECPPRLYLRRELFIFIFIGTGQTLTRPAGERSSSGQRPRTIKIWGMWRSSPFFSTRIAQFNHVHVADSAEILHPPIPAFACVRKDVHTIQPRHVDAWPPLPRGVANQSRVCTIPPLSLGSTRIHSDARSNVGKRCI